MKHCECGCGNPTKQRFVHGHNRRVPIHKRFNRFILMGPNNCWPWSGSRDRAGYGELGTGSKLDGTRGLIKAHRCSWELHRGPIPEGLQVLHHCDNPPCVNPDHLFLGTPRDNSDDKISKGRQNAPRGEAHHRAKLTWEDVRRIRAIHTDRYGLYPTKRLMAEYHVDKSTIQGIMRRKIWKEHGPNTASHN